MWTPFDSFSDIFSELSCKVFLGFCFFLWLIFKHFLLVLFFAFSISTDVFYPRSLYLLLLAFSIASMTTMRALFSLSHGRISLHIWCRWWGGKYLPVSRTQKQSESVRKYLARKGTEALEGFKCLRGVFRTLFLHNRWKLSKPCGQPVAQSTK